METVCKKNMCSACMLCADICPVDAINIVDSVKALNAEINTRKCINCGLCKKNCHIENELGFMAPIQCNQGWVNDERQRALSSSGGIAAAIERCFIKSGGIVCSCSYIKNQFSFIFVDKEADVTRLTGSKYVKSNPMGIYKKIGGLTSTGQKVLFVGLPCQVAALKLYIGEKNDNLFTIDLICHGTPSQMLFDSYLSCMNINVSDDVSFRKKNKFQICIDGKNIYSDGVRDEYIVGFLNGLFYTENCYNCFYARRERVSDITLGDSWGTDMLEEIKNGVSLILTQTAKGKSLVDMTDDICLFDVNMDKAICNNKQLISASEKNIKSELFWMVLSKGINVRNAVRICFPYTSLKQWVKSKLYYLKGI